MSDTVIINGRRVYSDKKVRSIINGKVYYTDGSWVDVNSGTMSNKGRGYISLDTPIKNDDTKQKTFGPQTFEASSVCIEALTGADVEVIPWDKTGVEVTINGTEMSVDAIKTILRGKELYISNQGNGRVKSHNNSIFVQNNSQVISGLFVGNATISNTNIRYSNKGSDTKVLVKVPKGMMISLINVDGDVQIGDTEGPVQINTNCDVSIGKVTDTQINVVGDSDVNVREVNGDLTINLTGGGDVDIKNGQVKNLSIVLTGSGDVDFRGTAINATLKLTGSGDINVKQVVNRPLVHCFGSGDVEIGNW